MKYLKQSTAVVIPFGPALNPTDGVTLVTTLVSALDNGSTGIFLCKNGAAAAIRHATVTATTYDVYGSYLVTLDTTDTNTLGRLRVMFAAAASCLPIWEDFTVLPGQVFDSIISGSDLLDVSTAQLAGQTVTAAAGVTFPTSVASPTNITAGTITTATSVSNDVGITQAAADKVWLTTVRTLSAAGVQAIWDALTSALTTVGSIGKLLVTNIDAAISSRSTYAGGDTSGTTTLLTRIPGTVQPQTGDSFARLGSPAGASVSADIAATPGAIWDVTLASHVTPGSTGFALNAAGSSGDPWGTALPGAYGGGTAGNILGNRLDVAVSTRTKPADTQAAVTTVTNLTNAATAGDFTATMKTSLNAATPVVTLAAGAIQAIWDALTSALTTVGSVGKLLVTNIDATISSRTKPADTQAAVTTVTNLTNAPTAGDLTAAMKASVTAAVPTANANADALLDRSNAIETGWTLRQAIRIALASVAGKLAGAATPAVTIRNVDDSKTRITATCDADGNRTAVTYDNT